MTDTTALHRRNDYRRFNASYFELVNRLEAWRDGAPPDKPPLRLGPFTRNIANTSKTDLYRFRTFLCNADPTDDYAHRLYNIFIDFTICMEPVDSADKRGPHWLAFRPNPISLAMNALSSES